MKKISLILVFLIQTIQLFAQPDPINGNVFINQSYYSKPFIDCVTDEKYFAKYANEAHGGMYKLMEPIKCKLHIPSGINKVWHDAENSNLHKKGEYDYSKDFWVGIRFNFYIAGTLVSTSFEDFEKPQEDSSFTFYFDLDPLDFEQSEGAIHFAYIELLKNLKKNGTQLGIEAALPSKNLDHKSFVPIAFRSFYLRFDDAEYIKWKGLYADTIDPDPKIYVETPINLDYNIRHKQLADSTMMRIFGETGFSKNFNITCLQNPCAKGYMYANTLESNNPCTSGPQDSCKEAIITYGFVKKDVPLTIKMSITIKDNGDVVYIENNQFGSQQISVEKQNILSISEIQKIINKQFPKESFTILADNRALVYTHSRIQKPKSKEENNKFNSKTGYKLVKLTKAGKNWENGFIYSTQSNNPRKPKRVYHFDAVTGKLLWITEIQEVIF